MRCRGVQVVAESAFLGRFLFSGLQSVAPYCVRGGVRVVSGLRGSPVAVTTVPVRKMAFYSAFHI
jgi:hypothetical protein